MCQKMSSGLFKILPPNYSFTNYLFDMHIYIYIYLPLHITECDTRLNFKQSLTGLNFEFSFSWTSCSTKVKGPNLSFYLLIAGREQLDSYLSRVYKRYVRGNHPHLGFEPS